MTKRSSGNSQTKKLITKQDMVLLKNSEEAKQTDIYGNLYDCLEPYTTLSIRDLNKDIVFDQKARMTLTYIQNYTKLIKYTKEEWYAKSNYYEATGDVYCQLCGTKNTYVCFIVNRKNGNELHVGRECVKEYSDFYGKKIDLNKMDKEVRDKEKDSRQSDFDAKLETDIDFTKRAREQIESFPVVLPFLLNERINGTIADCNRIRVSYTKSGGDLDEQIDKFMIKKREYLDLYEKAQQHYEANKENPLICTNEIASWVKEKFPSLITDIQKSNGILNENILQFIYEPNFISKNLCLFAECLKDKDITFVKLEGDVVRFSIKNNQFIKPIFFTMPIKSFMKIVGRHCLTQPGYSFKKNSLSPSIEDTAYNLNIILNYLNEILGKSQYSISVDDRTSELYWEKNQNIQRHKWSNNATQIEPVYKKVSVSQILNIMSQILLSDDLTGREVSMIITNRIEMSGKWITKEDKNRNAQLAAEMAGMQKQKEFTLYK